LFSIRGSAGAQPDRFPDYLLEWGDLPMRRPQLQLGIACGAQLDEIFVAAIVQLHAGDDLRVAAVEGFGEAQDGAQDSHHLPAFPAEGAEVHV
jgi:hypothetical protein